MLSRGSACVLQIETVPDIIVNFFVKGMGQSSHIGFLRFKAADVVGFNKNPSWKIIEANKLSAAIEKDTIPGFVMYKCVVVVVTFTPTCPFPHVRISATVCGMCEGKRGLMCFSFLHPRCVL